MSQKREPTRAELDAILDENNELIQSWARRFTQSVAPAPEVVAEIREAVCEFLMRNDRMPQFNMEDGMELVEIVDVVHLRRNPPTTPRGKFEALSHETLGVRLKEGKPFVLRGVECPSKIIIDAIDRAIREFSNPGILKRVARKVRDEDPKITVAMREMLGGDEIADGYLNSVPEDVQSRVAIEVQLDDLIGKRVMMLLMRDPYLDESVKAYLAIARRVEQTHMGAVDAEVFGLEESLPTEEYLLDYRKLGWAIRDWVAAKRKESRRLS